MCICLLKTGKLVRSLKSSPPTLDVVALSPGVRLSRHTLPALLYAEKMDLVSYPQRPTFYKMS